MTKEGCKKLIQGNKMRVNLEKEKDRRREGRNRGRKRREKDCIYKSLALHPGLIHGGSDILNQLTSREIREKISCDLVWTGAIFLFNPWLLKMS